MTKLEKLREDLAKADITLANARKRKAMLAQRIRDEEQRELLTMMDTMGLSFEDVKVRLAPASGDAQKGGEAQ